MPGQATAVKHHYARCSKYNNAMSNPLTPKDSYYVLAKNIRLMLETKGITKDALADKAGIGRRTLGTYIVSEEEEGHTATASIANVFLLAKALKVPAWYLLLPGLSKEMVKDKSAEKLFKNYLKSPPAGKESIVRVAEMAAEYKTKKLD